MNSHKNNVTFTTDHITVMNKYYVLDITCII